MLRKNPLSVAVERALYSVAFATTAATLPATALAQDTGEAATADEQVVVTGSRIAGDANLVTASPVTTVKPQEITNRGITRVEDLINDLPQITPEFTSNDSNGSTGTATLDLRGLGSTRTLVLTNGHRMGFGDVFALAPDINQIPGALIERIEILTGGASSTYGSDAVSGVVNFIMKTDYEGFKIDLQRSGYQHDQGNDGVQALIAARGFQQAPDDVTDGETTDINVTLGVNTADGRGNVTGYLGYRDIKAITHSERDFSACALNPGPVCGGSSTIPEGRITDFATFDFIVQGNDFVDRNGLLYNYAPLNYFQRPDERFTGGLFGRYELNEHLEGYAEFQFMDDRSLAQIAPSGAFFVTNMIPCENPFLSAQQFNAIGCTAPTDVVNAYIGRRNVEGGPRFDDLRHTSFRSLVGARGEISPNWSYDAFMNVARTQRNETYNNDMSITRIVRALDAVDDGSGNVVCRSVVDGSDPACVPWNIFQTGGVTPAAINYLVLPLFSQAELKQNQFVAFISGDLTDYGWKLPSASEGVQVVFGTEYRDEQLDFRPDNGFLTGDGAGQGGPTAGTQGAVLVKEFFTEFKIPIAQDRPGIRSLSADVRYRMSDYDTGVDADTYNVGGEYTPTDGLMFRGGISRAVRAPNIRELFRPQSIGLWQGVDPCAGPTPELSQAECANTGVLAADYGSVPDSPAQQYNGLFGGNPNLDAETSDSFTIGAVLTPEGFIPGLTLSLDYWNIEVEDAITGIAPETTIRQCAATGDPTLCGLINRGPQGNVWLGTANVVATDVNIGFFDVAGFDIVAGYGMEAGSHDLDFNLRGSLLDKFDQEQLPGNPVEACAGVVGSSCGRPRPDWKHTFTTVWTTPWDLTFSGSWRYISGIDAFPAPAAYTIGSTSYFDLAGNYRPGWFGDNETTLTFGISNILDNDPPALGELNAVPYSNGNTIPGTWDTLGRYYFFGLTQSFGEN